MMKGITNAELREKLEHIESELEQMKKKDGQSYEFIFFFSLSTLVAIIGSVMMLLSSNLIFLFFTILGIALMLVLIVVKFIMKNPQR